MSSCDFYYLLTIIILFDKFLFFCYCFSMELSDYIKQLRLKNKLTQRELADRLGVTAMHISQIEMPFSKVKKLPSEDLLRRIAQIFSRTEEERIKIQEILLLERAKLIAAPEVQKYVGKNIKDNPYTIKQVFPGDGMPSDFLVRLSADLKKIELNPEFYEKTGITENLLKSVLRGENLLSRKQVIALALVLNQPVDEYLELAEYMPELIKEMVEHSGIIGMFRTLKELTPQDIDKVINAVNSILEIHKKQRK